LRSGDPWRYGPCQGPLLIRTLFATCRSPGGTVNVRGRSASCWQVPTAQLQGVRSLSGANQRPLALELRSVSGADQCPLAKYRPPGGMVRVREPITILLPSADPWRLRSVWGANERPLTKCQPPGNTVLVRGLIKILLGSADLIGVLGRRAWHQLGSHVGPKFPEQPHSRSLSGIRI
jgi:hypothetical protein